jgi:hypothetical protein
LYRYGEDEQHASEDAERAALLAQFEEQNAWMDDYRARAAAGELPPRYVETEVRLYELNPVNA